MIFFVCVPIYLLSYRCDGHATISTFNLHFFHVVHVLTYIVFPSSPFFCPLLSNLFSMYADLSKNKIKLIEILVPKYGKTSPTCREKEIHESG